MNFEKNHKMLQALDLSEKEARRKVACALVLLDLESLYSN